MLWNLERNFLPSCDPTAQIPISSYKNTRLIFTLENLAHMMPCFLQERRWREEVVCELRDLCAEFGPDLISKLQGEAELERAFLLFSMFAAAYMFAERETPNRQLPKELEDQLNKAARMCGRDPLLNYTSYVLYNWQQSGNGVEALVTFTDSDTEKCLIETFVNIEFDLAALKEPDTSMWKSTLQKVLERLRIRSKMVAEDFDRLEGYYESNPFAQCGLFSYLYKLFGALDKDALLHNEENDICRYRPGSHNEALRFVNPLPCNSERDDCLELAISLHREMFMVRSMAIWELPRIRALEKCFSGGVKGQ